MWAAVRKKWDDLLGTDATVTLQPKVDDKPMYAHLFGLAGELEKGELGDDDRNALLEKAAALIDRFVAGPTAGEDP